VTGALLGGLLFTSNLQSQELPMTMTAHVSELRKKHETLAQKIEREERSPGANDLQVRRLKREKLRLKDQIKRLDPNLH
jgi:hypothetical protein